MTPKEKAKDLVFKLIDNTNYPYKKATFEQSRLCALICVDEILSSTFVQNNTFNYWSEVKEEIKIL